MTARDVYKRQLLDVDSLDHACGGRAGGETGGHCVIGELGLAQGKLGLGNGSLGVLCIQLVEKRPLLNPVPHLKGGLKDLTAGQGTDLVGLNGGHRAGAVHGDGKVLADGGNGYVLSSGQGRKIGLRPQEDPPDHGQCDERQKHPFDPLFLFLGQLERGARFLCGEQDLLCVVCLCHIHIMFPLFTAGFSLNELMTIVLGKSYIQGKNG